MSNGITARDFNPSNDQLVDQIKESANTFANLVKQMPPSRRRSIALTNIETASMFAVKNVFYDDDDNRRDPPLEITVYD